MSRKGNIHSFEADYYTGFYHCAAAQVPEEMRDASDHSNKFSSLVKGESCMSYNYVYPLAQTKFCKCALTMC